MISLVQKQEEKDVNEPLIWYIHKISICFLKLDFSDDFNSIPSVFFILFVRICSMIKFRQKKKISILLCDNSPILNKTDEFQSPQ